MNVFELFGIIAINNKDANKGIDETGRKAQTLQTKMGRAFTKIGKDAIACGKTIAKGLAVISAAGAAVTGVLLKSSVSAYAEFEQLEGGVKKLFGEDVAKTVTANASNAFKTAGLSANEYLNQTTRFSASLIKDLGNDTKAAAEMADIAIRDMADNASTFGTDITRIQDAYQNFAKGQFQLLDNLSLGYGGSQEEMARLINDSGVMGKNFKATAENVKDISFAKMIEAIHVIQKEMGIVDTALNEAKDTISGSFTMLKASWANLMTGLGDEENVEPLVDAFFEAGNTVLKNLAKVLPKIGNNIKAAMSRAGIHIKQAWEQNIWPTIQKFTIKFGIELPDWSVVDSSLNTWWSGTGKPAIENIKEFFGDIAAWVAAHKEEINGFLFALAGTLLIINAPLMLLIGALALVAANWKKIKEWVTKAIEEVDRFFTQTIPQAWKDFVTEIQTWINDHIVEPIQSAINKINEFLGIKDNKTVTITTVYKQVMEDPVGTFEKAAEVTPEQFRGIWNLFTKRGNQTTTTTEEGEPAPGKASGFRYVPYDNFRARLHMGEMVLPRNEAEEYRSGKGGGADTSRLETAVNSLIALTQQLVANTAGGQNVVLDTGVLVGQMAPRLDAQLGTLTARKERRG